MCKPPFRPSSSPLSSFFLLNPPPLYFPFHFLLYPTFSLFSFSLPHIHYYLSPSSLSSPSSSFRPSLNLYSLPSPSRVLSSPLPFSLSLLFSTLISLSLFCPSLLSLPLPLSCAVFHLSSSSSQIFHLSSPASSTSSTFLFPSSLFHEFCFLSSLSF